MTPNQKNIDMTRGSPWHTILSFSVPIIFANILQELYPIIDTFIVSRYIGLSAVAAISGTSSIRWMFTRICMDCAMAFEIATATRVGAHSPEEIKKITACGVKFGIGLTVIMLIILFPLTDTILQLIKIDVNILPDSKLYFLFSIIQIPFAIIYNISCALLRAVGDSKTPFYSIFISSIINVLLDLLFVVIFPLGVLGVAVATLVAQVFSSTIVFFAIFRKEPFRTTVIHWRRDMKLNIELMKLWGPMFANSICLSVGMIIAHIPVNARGALVAAGIQIGGQIYTILEASEKAIASGLSVYVSQNIGAREYDRVKDGMRQINFVSIIMSSMMCVTLVFFGDIMIHLFLGNTYFESSSSLAYLAAKTCLNTLAWGTFIMFPMHFYRAAIQAMGHPIFPMLGAIAQAVVRVICAIYAPALLGMVGLCIHDNAAALVCLPLVIIPYYHYISKFKTSSPVCSI